MPFCPNCGTEINGGAFCSNCGEKLAAPIAPVTPATPDTPVAPAPQEVPAVPTIEDLTEELNEATTTVAPEAPVAKTPIAETPVEEAPVVETQASPAYEAPAYTAAPVAPAYATVAPEIAQPEQKAKFNVFALIGLILSILSLTMCWLALFDLIFIIPAVVCLIIGFIKSKGGKKGMAIAGTVICAVALILSIVFTVVYVRISDSYYDDYDYDYSYDYDYDDNYDYDFGLFSNKLEDAYYDYCDYSYADLAADGSYLTIDTNPYDIEDEFDSDAWYAIQDVNDYLGLPDSVDELMQSTNALSGRQTQTYGEVTVTWTYHPDNGLEVMYTLD